MTGNNGKMPITEGRDEIRLLLQGKDRLPLHQSSTTTAKYL
jgi:hypothetical protein